MNRADIIRSTVLKVLSENSKELKPEKKLEILADMVSNIMLMKLKLLMEKGYTLEEALKVLKSMIRYGEELSR